MNKMENKVVLVTGSTDGIGKQTAEELAAMGAVVILHARNHERGNKTISELRDKLPEAKFDLIIADFAEPTEIKSMAAIIKEKYPVIDVLINNAGILAKHRELNSLELELTFMVNHLASFILTMSLLDHIVKSEQGRIINVSSMLHESAHLDFNNLQGEKNFDPYTAYAYSKLENILFTVSLAERLNETDVTVNALHPGGVNTKLLRAFSGGLSGISVKEGASTSIYLATAKDLNRVTGKYFVNKKQADPSPVAFDTDVQEKLWTLSEELAGMK